jgi:hypothetical protein
MDMIKDQYADAIPAAQAWLTAAEKNRSRKKRHSCQIKSERKRMIE